MVRPARGIAGAVMAVVLTLSAAPAAHAQLRDGFRSTLAARGDDNVTEFANFGFTVNIRGGTYNSASACMNGYLSLGILFEPGACIYQGQTTALSTLPQFADVFGTAVVGAYLILFPRNRVHTLIFYFVVSIPAVVVIGLWIVFQFINGYGATEVSQQTGGIAYGAHIGGFIAGLILINLFAIGKAYPIIKTRNF